MNNSQNGILCKGKGNKTYISWNSYIALNHKAGIRLDNYADICIIKNYIARNCNSFLKFYFEYIL